MSFMQVAFSRDSQVDQAMPRNLVKHVIKKRHAGV